MRARLFGCLAIATCALAPLLARAEHIDVVDPADTKGPLDVVRVEVEGIDQPEFSVFTEPRWNAQDIHDKGYVLLYFDTFRSERFDYFALVRSTGRGLDGLLWRDRVRKPDQVVAPLRVTRTSDDSLTVRVPLVFMKTDATRLHYTWYVQTLMTSNRCPRVCFDLAPDEGAVLEPRPGVTPTPTPSASATPSPPIE
ncbi:MAG: hypothetical protein ACRDJI_12075 [Actinomycetota bacterium]